MRVVKEVLVKTRSWQNVVASVWWRLIHLSLRFSQVILHTTFRRVAKLSYGSWASRYMCLITGIEQLDQPVHERGPDVSRRILPSVHMKS